VMGKGAGPPERPFSPPSFRHRLPLSHDTASASKPRAMIEIERFFYGLYLPMGIPHLGPKTPFGTRKSTLVGHARAIAARTTAKLAFKIDASDGP